MSALETGRRAWPYLKGCLLFWGILASGAVVLIGLIVVGRLILG